MSTVLAWPSRIVSATTLADRRSEFESVAAEPFTVHEAAHVRVVTDDRMPVGRHVVQAGVAPNDFRPRR